MPYSSETYSGRENVLEKDATKSAPGSTGEETGNKEAAGNAQPVGPTGQEEIGERKQGQSVWAVGV